MGSMSNPMQKKLYKDIYPDYSPPYPIQQDRTFIGLGNPLHDFNSNYSNPALTYQSTSSVYSTPYSHSAASNTANAIETIANVSGLSTVTLPDFQFAQKYGMVEYENMNKKLTTIATNVAAGANLYQRDSISKGAKEKEYREQKWFNSMEAAVNFIENEYEDREWAQYNWSFKFEENRVRGVCHCSGVSYKANDDIDEQNESAGQRRKKPKLNKIANEPVSNIFSKKNNCQRSIEIKKISDLWRLNIFAQHVEISCQACQIYRKINKKLRNWFYDLFAAGKDFYEVKAAYDIYLDKHELTIGNVPPPGPTFIFNRDNPVWYPNNKSLRNIERLAKRDMKSSSTPSVNTSSEQEKLDAEYKNDF